MLRIREAPLPLVEWKKLEEAAESEDEAEGFGRAVIHLLNPWKTQGDFGGPGLRFVEQARGEEQFVVAAVPCLQTTEWP